MIDKSFLEKIEDMVAVEEFTIDERTYTSKPIHAVKDPLPAAIVVGTLTALKDYLDKNPDALEPKSLAVHVVGPGKVELISKLSGPFLQRSTFMACNLDRGGFNFGAYYGLENFVILLQTWFEQDETTAKLLKLVGNISDGLVKTFGDDGISQSVTAKVGVAKVAECVIPNPVELSPFRTFMEISQPKSKFILRLKSGHEEPSAALFEADGGSWKMQAMKDIKAWLSANLPKDVIILA